MSDERYPLISILIPNYNYVKYVATAVDSALAQTYPNIEVVVSDNCSTDGAWELLNERYGADPRVRLHQNETNVGMARNFDRLMELARGRYVLCLSSDDFLFPQHLTQLEEVFAREPGLDVVYCGAYFAHEDGTVYTTRAMPGQFPVDFVDARDELVEEFTTVCPVCFPCALFKREVLLEPEMCGDPQNGQDARDWELIIRLALAKKRFAYVARPGMAIRLHGDQFSGDAYHRSGRNVLDFASYIERYADHPEFVSRMRGRETGVARMLNVLVAQAPSMNGGVTPFDEAQLAKFAALEAKLHARAAVYEPARVRESRVSVVVQTAGAPRPLLRALDSLTAQSFSNWEAVVVDHGSFPVEALLRAHPAWDRISYARLTGVHNPGAARNLGLRMIRGEYVASLEADNVLTPDHLQRSVDAIARLGAMASVAGSRLILERTNGAASTSEPLGESAPFGGEESDVARLEVAHAVPLDAIVFYRGMIDRIGTFNDSVPLLDDWDFTLRLARAARFAPTGTASVGVGTRIGLVAQRLGAALPHYLAVLDALYAAHPADARVGEGRAQHRASVVNALAAANDWLREPQGLIAFMDALGGRASSPVRATQPA
ncbi:MAG TPA: glycosyltransferase family 2 protein [Candidatus Elarobacter sp.]|nr:glycosyltransferase family 2 protein [Candidatus Elarobacter sp.]